MNRGLIWSRVKYKRNWGSDRREGVPRTIQTQEEKWDVLPTRGHTRRKIGYLCGRPPPVKERAVDQAIDGTRRMLEVSEVD